MKKYTYQGPINTSASLVVDGKPHEVLLHRGKVVSLPPDHDYTRTLVALGHIVIVDEPDASAAAGTATSTPTEKIKKGGQ